MSEQKNNPAAIIGGDLTVYLSLNEKGKQYAEELFMSGKAIDEVKEILLSHGNRYIDFSFER